MRKGLLRGIRVLLFSVIFMAACFAMMSLSFAQSYSVDITSYNSFRNQVYGHAYDVDGWAGYQCWDGAALLWQQLGRSLVTGNGAAAGTWDNAQTNAGNDFDLITGIQNVKRGDVVVFGYDATYFNAILDSGVAAGHIAFADEDYNGSGRLNIMGQNQLGVGAFSNQVVGVSAFRGAFRFKRWGNKIPVGAFEGLLGGEGYIIVQGWAYDEAAPSLPVNVDVYIGEPGTSDAEMHRIRADQTRTDLGNNHGFRAVIPTAKVGNYNVYCYALGQNANTLLSSQALNTTILKDNTKPEISDVQIYNLDSTGYNISCKVTDNAEVAEVTFPTWRNGNNQADLVWHTGTKNGNTYSARIPASSHGGSGQLITHIYAKDLAGNLQTTNISAYYPTVYVQVPCSIHTDISETVTCATTASAGLSRRTCNICGVLVSETVIPKIGSMSLSQTQFTSDGTEKRPAVTMKDSAGNTISATNYNVSYMNNTRAGNATAEVTFTGKYYSGSMSQQFTILPAAENSKAPEQKSGDNEPETPAVVQQETAKPTPAPVPETVVPVTPETEVDVEKAPSASQQEKSILTQKNDSDPKNSNFGLLQAKAVKVTNKTIKVQWKKVKGATKYIVYGAKCGSKMKKLKTLKTASYTHKKLKKGTYYKYLVVAVKGSKAISTSKTIHAATTGGKVGNPKSVKVNKKSVRIKIKKTAKITAKEVAASSKLKVKKHRAIAFESGNTNIATVTKKGVIKGIREGTCYVYAYAQNGVMAKVKVSVKK